MQSVSFPLSGSCLGAVLLSAFLTACSAPRQATIPDEPASWAEPPTKQEDEERIAAAPASPASAPERAAAPAEPPAQPERSARLLKEGKAKRVPYAGPRGVIKRPDLLALLDRQPAAFLRSVDTEPRFESGRFRGWAINSFYPEDPRFEGIDLMRGDVVTKVNGLPIEMPEQFMLVWQEMRKAKELRVDLLRNGQPHVSRWSIEE